MGNIEIRDIKLFQFFQGDGIRPHTHDFYQIYHVVSGSGTAIIEGEKILLASNMCVLISPGQLHMICRQEHGNLRQVDITFDIYDPEYKMKLDKTPQWQFMNQQSLDLLWSSRSEFNSRQSFNRNMANILLEQYLCSYYRIWDNTCLNFELESPEDAQMLYDIVDPKNVIKIEGLVGLARTIADYVIEHCFTDLSLDHMAKALKYNRSHLCKVFKDKAGITIIDYANHLRISKALELVRFSDKKMLEICSLSGFYDVHYFTKVFKDFTGYTPSELRDKEKYTVYTDFVSRLPLREPLKDWYGTIRSRS